MRLEEKTAVPDEALPVTELADHLRLGSGLEVEGLEAGQLRAYLRAAMAGIEGRIGKALISRRFALRMAQWRSGDRQALPLAPVSAVISVKVIEAGVPEVEVPSQRWYLEGDGHRPHLVARGVSLPVVPRGAEAEVVFEAGFGAWAAVPADLRQAVLLLAAQFHEYRHDPGLQAGALPFGIQALIERWRIVRVLGGGA